MGGLVYGMTLGVVSGYYEVAVGGAFVVVGFLGVAAGLIRQRATAALVVVPSVTRSTCSVSASPGSAPWP